jgi:hypothetical protein
MKTVPAAGSKAERVLLLLKGVQLAHHHTGTGPAKVLLGGLGVAELGSVGIAIADVTL